MKDGNTFKCPKCPFENATLNDLLEHLKFAHTNLLNDSIPGNAPNSAQNDKQDSKEENQNEEQEEEDSDVEIIPNKTQPGSSVIMNKAPPPLIPAPHIIHGHHHATQNHFAQKGKIPILISINNTIIGSIDNIVIVIRALPMSRMSLS